MAVGDRVMSHDETNHVVPSYDLYQGRGLPLRPRDAWPAAVPYDGPILFLSWVTAIPAPYAAVVFGRRGNRVYPVCLPAFFWAGWGAGGRFYGPDFALFVVLQPL